MQLDRDKGGFSIDASLLGALLNVPPPQVHALMRQNEITSLCERGEREHKGQYRVTFYYRGRRARLRIDESGRIIHRSVIDLGERPLPSTTLRPGTPRPMQDLDNRSAVASADSHSATEADAVSGNDL